MSLSHLDAAQVLPLVLDETTDSLRTSDTALSTAFDPVTGAIKVEPTSGSLVTDKYDEIDISYIVAGNGAGQAGTVLYKLASATVATLTLSYDSSDRLISVVKS